MQHAFLLLAFLALFGHLAAAARWEIIPLVADADFDNFNISSYDPAVWNVTSLPAVPVHGTAPSPMGDDCAKDGNIKDFCKVEPDETQCNIAVRIPAIPRPSWQETRADSWVYTNDCSRIRGCKLLQNRDGDWWSIYSDLKYTVEVRSNENSYPWFAYADFLCKGYWCGGWSYLLDDPDNNGESVYVYRRSFPCNQP